MREELNNLKPCPFCGSPAAEPDGNNATWCSNIACFEGYVNVVTWNQRHGEVAPPQAMILRDDFTEEELAALEEAMKKSAGNGKLVIRSETDGDDIPW